MALITSLTRIEFEDGAVRRLPGLLDHIGVRRPMIVTDRGLLASGIVEPVTARFALSPTVFADTPANPTEEAVMAAFARHTEDGCDGIGGIGGGSSIDLATAVRLLTGHPPPLARYTAIEGGARPMMEIVAGEALQDHCHATNPRLATKAEYLGLLHASF